MSAEDTEKKSKIKPAQVAAAALASLTAAFLGSTLGVYGTVIGAGLVSVFTTIGGEFYLRSFRRSAEAAKRAREAALSRAHRAPARPSAWGSAAETVPFGVPVRSQAMPARHLARPPVVPQAPPATPPLRLRWPVIAAMSVLAFALGMVAVTGIEGLTGKTLSGGEGSTVARVVSGTGTAPVQEEPVAGDVETGESPAVAPEVVPTTEAEPTPTGEPVETTPAEEATTTEQAPATSTTSETPESSTEAPPQQTTTAVAGAVG